MKTTKKQLKRIIREEVSRILEYEQYVDEDGNVWDDEGNVTRHGASFGQRYGGETYTGTNPPWSARSGRSARRSSSSKNSPQIDMIKVILDVKEDKFLRSILQQLEAGRTLSVKQKAIVRKIITKTAKGSGVDSAKAITLFESRKTRLDSKF
jgi:hypothetical protein